MPFRVVTFFDKHLFVFAEPGYPRLGAGRLADFHPAGSSHLLAHEVLRQETPTLPFHIRPEGNPGRRLRALLRRHRSGPLRQRRPPQRRLAVLKRRQGGRQTLRQDQKPDGADREAAQAADELAPRPDTGDCGRATRCQRLPVAVRQGFAEGHDREQHPGGERGRRHKTTSSGRYLHVEKL